MVNYIISYHSIFVIILPFFKKQKISENYHYITYIINIKILGLTVNSSTTPSPIDYNNVGPKTVHKFSILI